MSTHDEIAVLAVAAAAASSMTERPGVEQIARVLRGLGMDRRTVVVAGSPWERASAPEEVAELLYDAGLRAATPAPPEPALRDDEVRLAAALVYIGIAPAKSTERARSVLRYLAAIPEKP